MIIKKPKKVIWRAYLDNGDAVDLVKSKKLKKLIKQMSLDLPKLGYELRIEKKLLQSTFLNWLEIYKSVIGKKEIGNLKIDKDWYQDKLRNNKDVFGIFIYNEGQMIGGNIGSLLESKLSVGYGAVQPQDTKYNMGAWLDFESIKYGQTLGYKVVSFGKDTNFYGGHLSSGLFSHKARLGLTIEADESAGRRTGYEVLNTEDVKKYGDNVLFLGENKVLYVIYKNEQPDEKQFLANGVEKIEYIKV